MKQSSLTKNISRTTPLLGGTILGAIAFLSLESLPYPMLTKSSTQSYPKATEKSPHGKVIPTSLGGWLRQRLLGIPLQEATVNRRGFKVSHPQIQQRLETIGKTFLQGYHAAIGNPHPEALIAHLDLTPSEYRGFAYEGAAMGLALLDYFTPWQAQRVQGFLQGAGANHVYMAYVGVGWALARLPFALKHYLAQLDSATLDPKVIPLREFIRTTQENCHSRESGNPLALCFTKHEYCYIDPLLGWLAIDGYGFHQGYFYWRKYVNRIAIPQALSGYSTQVFDQGLGRSLWFVRGADIAHISQTIQNFQPDRRGDLWSGVGLACAYAGGVTADEMKALPKVAKGYLTEIAQGVAFAAKARLKALNLTEHTEIACQILCGIGAEAAASLTDLALVGLSGDSTVPVYEVWRKRIREHFSALEDSQ